MKRFRPQPSRTAGVTIIEILAAVTIIGFLATLAAMRARSTLDESDALAALNQMDRIKTAVVDGFYRDFGYIPEEVHWLPRPGTNHGVSLEHYAHNCNPEYATRFLCLPRDCSDTEIAANFEKLNNKLYDRTIRWNHISDAWLGEDFRPGCYFLGQGLNQVLSVKSSTAGNVNDVFLYLILADPHCGSRGWSGAYLDANSSFNATALNRADDNRYPAEFYSDASDSDDFPEDVSLPVISTPWADALEAAAREAETAEDTALAAQLRKGRYYQILVYSRNDAVLSYHSDGTMSANWGRWIQVPETAVVVSRGPDGLPGAEGDDRTIGAEEYWSQCADIWQFGLTDAQRACFERLKISDPNDPGYVDIGDDLVIFMFGGGAVRSPLEK